MDGSLIAALQQRIVATLRKELDGLKPEEVAVLLLLRDRLQRKA